MSMSLRSLTILKWSQSSTRSFAHPTATTSNRSIGTNTTYIYLTSPDRTRIRTCPTDTVLTSRFSAPYIFLVWLRRHRLTVKISDLPALLGWATYYCHLQAQQVQLTTRPDWLFIMSRSCATATTTTKTDTKQPINFFPHLRQDGGLNVGQRDLLCVPVFLRVLCSRETQRRRPTNVQQAKHHTRGRWYKRERGKCR